ncbi:MAG: hypothetical protein DIZ80_08865 [endosymbiont of Galathealinum brachiosum]|uniref:Uncharacterized protein n=1 Tax=endosymbiont of Galathealinum brachiosum TaxID=2200906 RepID=A0A370DE07_9GAMM|nr:MAG: hypothetical protein DIZ80_08865 [endosymbiont of Galathealinum brachiosum]
MTKSISLLVKVAIFAAITIIGIIYVFNRPAVESISSYEKQEMVKPNKGKSIIDDFFSSKETKRRNAEENDDVSLTGNAGRYDEVRIGKSTQ